MPIKRSIFDVWWVLERDTKKAAIYNDRYVKGIDSRHHERVSMIQRTQAENTRAKKQLEVLRAWKVNMEVEFYLFLNPFINISIITNWKMSFCVGFYARDFVLHKAG